jgi:hypothetical protein
MTTDNTITHSPVTWEDCDDDASTVVLTPTTTSLERNATAVLLAFNNSDARSISDELTEEETSVINSDDTDDTDADKIDYEDDGPIGYYEFRACDTLSGWTYSEHPGSICLTPPRAWLETPCELNVQWYKRPLFYSKEHRGYFMSDAQCFVDKVKELGAICHQERMWGDAN